jgi:hypothetical protein
MGLIDRLRTSHCYAADAVQRAVAGSAAYSEEGPSLLVRMRMYLSILGQRFAQGE